MKKLLTILFILIAFKSNSQTVQKIAPGEYCTLNIAADGKLYSSGSNFTLLGTGNTGRIGLPNLVKQQSGAAMPLFKSAWAGLDDAAAIDVSGNVWKIGGATLAAAGNGSTEPDYNNPDTALKYYHAIKILTDSSGNSFTGITMCAQFWESYQTKGWFAVKGTDSTLWIWGGDELGNFRGTGVAQQYMSRPRKVTIPGNRKVLQVVAGTFVVVRCSDGTVWTWGGGAGCNDYHAALGNGCTGTSYKYPTQVPGIRNAKWIDGGRSRAFVICQNDTVWAWGNKAYLGIGTTDGNPQTTPLYVTPIWNLPHGVTKIVSNVNATHAILTDSSLWAWGNSPQSEAGTGANLDRNRTSALLGPYPANWSWDYSTPLIVTSPTQIISTRHDFVNIYGAMPYTYWMFDEAANGQIYFNGRNKGTIANNGEINPDTAVGSQGSYYDNSWNKLTPVPVDLFSLRSIISILGPEVHQYHSRVHHSVDKPPSCLRRSVT